MVRLIALVAGLPFGLGLTISGMINPGMVLGFLDVAGDWDASLAYVMAAAIPVAAVGFALAKQRAAPLCATVFSGSTKTRVDVRLVAGAILFEIGWGLVGYCPDPALASLGFGLWQTWLFLLAMLAGMGAFHGLERIMALRPPAR